LVVVVVVVVRAAIWATVVGVSECLRWVQGVVFEDRREDSLA